MNSIPTQGAQGCDLEIMPFPCCLVHVDGAIVASNSLADARFAADVNATRSSTLQSRLHHDDAPAVLASLWSSNRPFETDCRVSDASGTFRWFMLSARPVESSDVSTWLCSFIDIDARKTREIALDREVRIRDGMLDASVDCIKVITADGVLTHMNAAGCQALGLSADSTFGMTWVDLLPESVRESGRHAVAMARAGHPARFPGSSQLPGEPPRYWDNMLTPLHWERGEVTSILCMSRDVTHQREAETRLELAVRATDDAIWDWHLHSNRMHWNEAMQRCHGYRAEDVGETPEWWLERIHADDRARVQTALQAVLRGHDAKYAMEYRFRRADGRYIDVHERGYLHRDQKHEAVRVVGTMLDQTDRKAIERNLKQLNRTLEARANERTKELERLWSTSPDVLLVLGPDGVIRRASPAVSEALGREPDDIVGHHLGEYVMEEDSARLNQALLSITNESAAMEVRHRHRDGSTQWIAWATASSDEDIFATGRVVTSLRKTEEALRQSQKMEAIGRLTGHVAHDFNNLLHVIQSSVDVLRRPGLEPHKQARCMDSIANTADRGARLTRQLLAYGRRSTLTPTRFDAGANIRALSELIATLVGKGIDIRIEEQRACHVFADSSQFDTAIVNLAVNACDAMKREGCLKIGIAPGAHGMVAVTVEDQGEGIPKDRIETIFEPFFTTKPPEQGTGLGLSQVFGFVKQSGGDIFVESEVGVGSTFTICLPERE